MIYRLIVVLSLAILAVAESPAAESATAPATRPKSKVSGTFIPDVLHLRPFSLPQPIQKGQESYFGLEIRTSPKSASPALQPR